MSQLLATHAFTLSGLGQSPFSHCSASHELATKNVAFFCEHCGTILKNRHFVMSSDGKVSVVGIDCLRKTDDSGLIAATNQAIKEANALERHQAKQILIDGRLNNERQHFKGKTKVEACTEILSQVSKAEDKVIEQIDDLDITYYLAQSGFGTSMIELAAGKNDYSQGMLNTMLEICAKCLSKSRKNSAAYKASLPKANDLVKELNTISSKQTITLNNLFQKRIDIINTVIR